MKKRIAMIAMMASLVTTTAFAEGVKIDGSIKSAETKTILAPYSGVVGHYAVTAGRGEHGRRAFCVAHRTGLCRF